ncbi:hypothetical protein ACFO8O_02680 [Hephaestia sp. GCM10023244]|uniref:hypothetical protein n=1 Tax=unclassified Hephaestia TaxID=2631281 RepID=UPI0020777181|nr:hypothetical protein [Hephaestia sp. MAHUQ-44]MCM8729877.1 hypothetical protein [Hephaestia sp. MAHUQ-44]
MAAWSLAGRNAVTVFKIAATGACLALMAFSVSACGDSSSTTAGSGAGDSPSAAAIETAAVTAASVGAGRSGVVTTAAGRYDFTPSTCGIHVADGVADVEIAGPGTDPDGKPVYVELSSTGNALAIGLGVDRAFATAEHKLIGGQHVTRPFTVVVSGQNVRVSNIALATDQGAPFDQDASFEADCGPAR